MVTGARVAFVRQHYHPGGSQLPQDALDPGGGQVVHGAGKRACCGLARKTPFYNRCGAGKWAAAGREPEAAIVLIEPQDSTTCG